jgi:predicted DNA-binding transcriptional regulator YafY
MRADRLIAMLMLLQSRGRMTAIQLADELEVSERTIYRDVNALCYSGVPIYTERGPGGGISLIEKYRSDLTGLTREEVQALFVISIPPALSDLGLDKELRAAMLKLSAALPATLRGDEQAVRQRIHIDPIPWRHEGVTPSKTQLQMLQKAIWESLEIHIRYQIFMPQGLMPLQSLVDPYGLIAKATDWYMVAKRQDHMFVLRIDRIQNIEPTGNVFKRPDDFNLTGFWEQWCQDSEDNRPSYPVIAKVSPSLSDDLEFYLGNRLIGCGEPDQTGWMPVELNFDYYEQARKELLGFGGAIEVITPIALKYSMIDFAEQVIKTYKNKDTPGTRKFQS